MRRTVLRNIAKLSIGTAISLAYVAPALAQDAAAPAADAEQAEDDNTVVVTGSRLARDPNATAPSPIAVVSAADIAATGVTDATAALRQIPALISSGTVADSIERGGGGIGQATLNLRQLGSTAHWC